MHFLHRALDKDMIKAKFTYLIAQLTTNYTQSNFTFTKANIESC